MSQLDVIKLREAHRASAPGLPFGLPTAPFRFRDDFTNPLESTINLLALNRKWRWNAPHSLRWEPSHSCGGRSASALRKEPRL